MVALVLAYYFWEPSRGWLAGLAELKRGGGYLFSFVSGGVAGGVLPEALRVAAFQRCLPPPLQFPLFTLALTLRVMIFTWISHAHSGAT